MSDKIAVMLSGGMDSATLLYYMKPIPCLAITIDYGQSHRREIEFAYRLCNRRGIEVKLAKVSGICGGSLVDGGTHTSENAVVPNRNAMFISIGLNIAHSHGCNVLALGCNKSDYQVFKDCRLDYLCLFSEASMKNLGIDVTFPFINKTKKEIAEIAVDLEVPLHATWSCYKGLDAPCGTCGACIERRSALSEVFN